MYLNYIVIAFFGCLKLLSKICFYASPNVQNKLILTCNLLEVYKLAHI